MRKLWGQFLDWWADFWDGDEPSLSAVLQEDFRDPEIDRSMKAADPKAEKKAALAKAQAGWAKTLESKPVKEAVKRAAKKTAKKATAKKSAKKTIRGRSR